MASISAIGFAGAAGEPRLPASVWEKENRRRLRWLALTVVLLGLIWRFSRYLLRFPVWGDEAMLLVNYFNHDYLDLLGPIDNCQVAPILFHWIELTFVRFLGADEWVVRLAPFLAGLANLALFWRLAHLTLPPLGRTLAVGILSVSIWPVSMGTLAKPYAGDLFFSLVFLTTAVSWLRQPSRRTPLVVLAVVAPLAVLTSYPSVFIGGAVSLALLPAVWRTRDRKATALFVLYNLLLAGTFAGHYLFVARSHLASPAGESTMAVRMQGYWDNGFPPLPPWRFLPWFLLTNTGQMAAYPIGSAKGGSIVTVFFALVGVRHCWRHGQRGILVLAAGALGLGFLAALLRCYPYGTSCRLAQHLAPFYCLLAGLGAAVLIQQRRTAPARWKASLAGCGLLLLVGGVGIGRDFVHPYRGEDCRWAQAVVEDLMSRAGDDPILTAQDLTKFNPLLEWHLGRYGARVTSPLQKDWQRISRESSSVRIVSYGEAADEAQWLFQALRVESCRPWRCVERRQSILPPRRAGDETLACWVYHGVCDQPAATAAAAD